MRRHEKNVVKGQCLWNGTFDHTLLIGWFRTATRKRHSNRCAPIGQVVRRVGGGVIWHRIHLEAHVIPAQAGIHCAGRWKRSADRLDSRLRGNDGTREPPCLSNDATTGLEIEDIEQSRTVARHCTLKGMPVPRLRDGLYDPRAAGFPATC